MRPQAISRTISRTILPAILQLIPPGNRQLIQPEKVRPIPPAMVGWKQSGKPSGETSPSCAPRSAGRSTISGWVETINGFQPYPVRGDRARRRPVTSVQAMQVSARGRARNRSLTFPCHTEGVLQLSLGSPPGAPMGRKKPRSSPGAFLRNVTPPALPCGRGRRGNPRALQRRQPCRLPCRRW